MTRRALCRLLLLVLLGGCSAPPEPAHGPTRPGRGEPRVPASFARAKQLALALYADHRVTLYCGCGFDDRRRIRAEACGYRPRHASRRSARIEWEHLVAAYEFGASRACWRGKSCTDRHGRAFGGRRCCRQVDPEFRRMEADLQNLSPEIGELNADRSNYGFGEVAGEARAYGACDFEVDRRAASAEAAPSVRGEVARAYLYMHAVYGPRALPLSRAQLQRFEVWDRADPPSDWERVRNERIKAIQGVGNPWLEP